MKGTILDKEVLKADNISCKELMILIEDSVGNDSRYAIDTQTRK